MTEADCDVVWSGVGFKQTFSWGQTSLWVDVSRSKTVIMDKQEEKCIFDFKVKRTELKDLYNSSRQAGMM